MIQKGSDTSFTNLMESSPIYTIIEYKYKIMVEKFMITRPGLETAVCQIDAVVSLILLFLTENILL